MMTSCLPSDDDIWVPHDQSLYRPTAASDLSWVLGLVDEDVKLAATPDCGSRMLLKV